MTHVRRAHEIQFVEGQWTSVEELSSGLNPGQLLALVFAEEDLLHDRMVLGPGAQDAPGLEMAQVLASDGDIHDEDVSGSDQDCQRCINRERLRIDTRKNSIDTPLMLPVRC